MQSLYNSTIMVEDALQENNKLTGSSIPPQQKKKKTSWWRILIDVVVGTILVCTCLVCADLAYLNLGFNEQFFVNGMSMYPTLNGTGQRMQADGTYRLLNWDDRNNRSNDIVDYGRAKVGDKGNWRAGLARFDIVVSYYPDDFVDGHVKERSDPKIKRVIGFPGETLTFEVVNRVYDESGVGGTETVGGVTTKNIETFSSDWNAAWGKTTIVTKEGETVVLKPLYTEADYPDIGSKRYPDAGIPGGLVSKTWVLGEDEYFLMGDNRGGTTHSQDSREKGPVKGEMIIGKAFLITSQRRLALNEDGTLRAEFDINLVKWPWEYKHLDRH